MTEKIFIRNARRSDLDAVIALDDVGEKTKKGAYWLAVFDHYVSGKSDRIFLIAEKGGDVVGFIVGEVRAWEFGSPPCGWVFALAVSPTVREMGIGQRMFDEICKKMKESGISTVRTMTDIDNKLTLSFFRSMGMSTGRYIELERRID